MSEPAPALDAARRHREEFGVALGALEEWVSAEIGPGWGPELVERVLEVEECPVERVALVEHPGLVHQAREAVDLARAVLEPPVEPDASKAAAAARSLAEATRAHRRRGAHVIYEAYELDLGDGD